MGRLTIALLLFLTASATTRAEAQQQDGGFNRYILASIEMLAAERARLGYADKRFTQDLQFGDTGTLRATDPPGTMCVAAQLEILVEALNIYSRETGDYSPFHFLPKITWTRLRPRDLAGQIWLVKYSPSTGAAHAFENYGMGMRIPFRDLFPGAFINFNRTNGSGHGAVFLGYIDAQGNDLDQFSGHVAGFKYFSAQGRNLPDGGLDYRWAFFSDANCPALTDGRRRDCGVIRSEARNLLVAGFVSMPSMWDADKAADTFFSANNTGDPTYRVEGQFNPAYFTGVTTDG